MRWVSYFQRRTASTSQKYQEPEFLFHDENTENLWKFLIFIRGSLYRRGNSILLQYRIIYSKQMYVEEIIISPSLFVNPWHKVDHQLFTQCQPAFFFLFFLQGECLYNIKMTFNFVLDYLYNTPYFQRTLPNRQSLMITISASILHCKTGVNIYASFSRCSKPHAHKKVLFFKK